MNTKNLTLHQVVLHQPSFDYFPLTLCLAFNNHTIMTYYTTNGCSSVHTNDARDSAMTVSVGYSWLFDIFIYYLYISVRHKYVNN